MFRRAIRRMAGRALLMGGAVVVGRWALGALLSRQAVPARANVALRAGQELTGIERRVLVVARNAGDTERFLNGTLQLLRNAGSHVAIAVLGKNPQSAPVSNEPVMEAVGTSVTSSGVVMYQLSLADGSRPDMVFAALKELVLHEKPDVILTCDPEGLGRAPEPQEVAAGEAILDMAQAGLLGGARIYFYGSRNANVLVDISGVQHDAATGLASAAPDAMRAWERLSGARQASAYTEALCRIV